ncbi:MAG: serine O-acetyltransferase EpsC [Anaerorhabdus sp.]
MLKDLRMQIEHIKKTDPAAKNIVEILLLYPSIHVLAFYRVAHFFYTIHFFLLARILSQFARFLTGIEIHPGATIGKGLFIDHGMGTVIGETAVIGDRVKLFHGVTLGGLENKTGKRHPTVNNDAIIGANAQLLGDITIGESASVGANAVVLIDVPAFSIAVGVPAVIKEKKKN